MRLLTGQINALLSTLPGPSVAQGSMGPQRCLLWIIARGSVSPGQFRLVSRFARKSDKPHQTLFDPDSSAPAAVVCPVVNPAKIYAAAERDWQGITNVATGLLRGAEGHTERNGCVFVGSGVGSNTEQRAGGGHGPTSSTCAPTLAFSSPPSHPHTPPPVAPPPPPPPPPLVPPSSLLHGQPRQPPQS